MNKKFKNKEKGFALPLALLLLVVMGLMSSILISKTTTEHKANTTKDLGQQAFYAAESGIAEAKKWMVENSDTLKTKNPSDIDGNLKIDNLFDNDYENFGLVGEDPRTVIPSISTNPERFLSPGAPRGIWLGLKVSI